MFAKRLITVGLILLLLFAILPGAASVYGDDNPPSGMPWSSVQLTT
jgi:hypothetical protein